VLLWLADGLVPQGGTPSLVATRAIWALIGVALATVPLLLWPDTGSGRSASGVLAVLGRGIPDVSAEAAGVFRLGFGLLLCLTVLDLRLDPNPFPVALHRSGGPLADWMWVHGLASRPTLVAWLEIGTMAVLVAFALGLWTRAAHVLAALGLAVWTLVRLTHTGTHPWAVALVAIFALLPCRLGDAFSLDETVRRWRRRGLSPGPRGRSYGFAVWIPSLVLGTAMAGAAIAKLRGNGLAWITNGTVKYYFVVDAANAPVDWGLAIASRHWLSVLFAAGAIAIEAALVLPAFMRPGRARSALGLAGLGLLLGLYLFQGEVWLAWWTLWIVAFMPWQEAFEAMSRRLPRLVALADGACPLCRRTAHICHGLDWFNRVEFADFNDPDLRNLYAPGVSEPRLRADMHVVRLGDRSVAAGYDAYLRLAGSIPFLWPALVVGRLPGIRQIGARVYRTVADSRGRDHTCQDGICETAGASEQGLPRRFSQTAPALRLRPVQMAVAMLVVGLQVVATAFRIEVEPLLSDYPMYSSTYASIEAFERGNPLRKLARVESDSTGERRDVTKALDDLGLFEPLREIVRRQPAGGALSGASGRTIRAAVVEFERVHGQRLGRLTFLTETPAFDWSRGRFAERPAAAVVGTLDTERLVYVPGAAP
jgi:predicted DCC family thiol-disulfide oxidoreductase YuxK